MKKAAHVLAVGFAALTAFLVSPAGVALIQQYPRLAGLTTLAALGMTYFNPKSAQ